MDENDGSKPTPSVSDATLELVESTYQSIVDPRRFIDLLDIWADRISQLGPDSAVALDQTLERHLAAAMPLLEKASESQVSEDDVIRMVEAESKPALALSPGGAVVAANRAARARLALVPGDLFDRDAIDLRHREAFDAFLQIGLEGRSGRRHCVLKYFAPDGDALLVDLQSVELARRSEPIFVLKVFELTLTPQAYAVLKEAFDLTAAEIAVIEEAMKGGGAPEIAEARNTSVETVRTQLKAIRQKTETRGQVELMRLVAGLSTLTDAEEAREGAAAAGQGYAMPRRHRLIELPGGRRCEYLRLGPAGGRAVLCLHAALFGLHWPKPAVERLNAAGYTLWIPARPGYGLSTELEARAGVEEVAQVLRDFVDAAGLGDFAIAAQGVASIHACALAGRMHNRVRCVIGVGGYLPVDFSRMFESMSPWQRTMLHTARFSPRIVGFLIKSGRRMMAQIGPREFFAKTYSDSPSDQRVVADPDLLALLQVSFDMVMAQSSSAYVRDFQLVTQRWDEVFDGVRAPIAMIHGDEKQVMRADVIAEFCATRPHMRFHGLEGAGQLLLYSHPETVAAAMIDDLDRHF